MRVPAQLPYVYLTPPNDFAFQIGSRRAANQASNSCRGMLCDSQLSWVRENLFSQSSFSVLSQFCQPKKTSYSAVEGPHLCHFAASIAYNETLLRGKKPIFASENGRVRLREPPVRSSVDTLHVSLNTSHLSLPQHARRGRRSTYRHAHFCSQSLRPGQTCIIRISSVSYSSTREACSPTTSFIYFRYRSSPAHSQSPRTRFHSTHEFLPSASTAAPVRLILRPVSLQ